MFFFHYSSYQKKKRKEKKAQKENMNMQLHIIPEICLSNYDDNIPAPNKEPFHVLLFTKEGKYRGILLTARLGQRAMPTKRWHHFANMIT